jgi:predicted PurR-regulated permease PerM
MSSITTTTTGPVPQRPAGWSAERIGKAILMAGAGVLAVWTIWYFGGLLAYLLLGIALAYLIRPATDAIQGLGLSRIGAILVTFALLIGTLLLMLTVLVPFAALQVQELSQQLSVEALGGMAASTERFLQRFFPVQEGAILDGFARAAVTLFHYDRVADTVGAIVSIFADVFYAVLIVPFVTFFFLKDGSLIRRSMLSLVPNRYFETTLSTMEKVETNLGRYFRALLVQCVAVAVLASCLLYLVGLRYALAVGLFAGLANAIPYFGPLIGFLAGSIAGVAQTGDFSLIPGILVAMALTQLADNAFLQPFIFSRAARVHPLVILFGVLIGAQLGGLVGMLLAIPVLTTLLVISKEIVWSARNYRILQTES